MKGKNNNQAELTDAIERRIVDRLGERQKKFDRIAEMEKKRNVVPFYKRTTLWVTAVAACVAVVLVVSPLLKSSTNPIDELGIGVPELSEFRAGIPHLEEIQKLLKEEKWDQALADVKIALKQSDSAMEMYSKATEAWIDDEGLKYEAEAEQIYNCELRWIYIYLLVRTENNTEAINQLSIYLMNSEYIDNKGEALALQEKLNKK